MRSREQVIWDFVQAWLAKAQRDLKAAEILLAAPGELGEMVGFHCQQAVEKFLKAYLATISKLVFSPAGGSGISSS